jgi:porin
VKQARGHLVKLPAATIAFAILAMPQTLLAEEPKSASPGPTEQPKALPDIAISGAFTQFLGAAVAGDGSDDLRYGGRVDLYVSVPVSDTFSVSLHPEFIYGKNVNNVGDGSILPLNTSMLLPSNGGEDFDLSVSMTQKIGSKASLTFGKINLLDLVAKTPIIGGGGLDGFQNIALAAPPSGLVPPSLLGAMLSVPTKSGIFGLWVYDPANQTNKTGFESPFSTGVTFLASATFPVKVGGKTGYQNFKIATNTKTGTDLRDIPELLLPPVTTLIGQRKGAWNVNYSFQQYIWENPNAKGKGWGVFGQLGVSDGNPTPLDWSGLIGIGGNLWESRPDDRFGVAYFRQSFSNVLAQAVSPVFALSDEQGVEAYYTAQIGKQFRLTADVQIIDPAGATRPTALVFGLRAKAGF